MKRSALISGCTIFLLLSALLTACYPGSLETPAPMPEITITTLPETVSVTPATLLSTVQIPEKSAVQTGFNVLMLTDPPLESPVVTELQSRLLVLGYHIADRVTGVFDEQTDTAVRYFQWFNRLSVDGIVNQSVLEMLDSHDAVSNRPMPPYPGSRIVRRPQPLMCEEPMLQARLVELGYLNPAAEELSTRTFGIQTEAAVIAFQQTHGLQQDGQVDLLAWTTLFSPLALPSGSQLRLSAELLNPPFKTNFYPVIEGAFSVVMVGKTAVIAGSYSQLQLVDTVSGYISAPVRMGVCDEAAISAEEVSEGIASMIVAGDNTWVNFINAGSRLQGIDPMTGETTPVYDYSTAEMFFPATALGYDGISLWVSGGNDQVLAVNPPELEPVRQVTVGYMTRGVMVFEGGCMWVAKDDGALVAAFDTGTANCQHEGDASMLPAGTLAFDGSHVWSAVDGMLFSVDLSSGEQRSPLSIVPDPTALLYTNHTMWVADRYSDSVTAVDPVSGEVLDILPAGDEPSALASDGEYLWVLNQASRTFQRLVHLTDSPPTSSKPEETAQPTAPAVVTPVQMRTLILQSPRLNGPYVLEVQNCLKKLGFNPGETDGWYGPMTAEAVKTYQLARGIQSDGRVATITWQSIFVECADQ